jgi:hypothetical protein
MQALSPQIIARKLWVKVNNKMSLKKLFASSKNIWLAIFHLKIYNRNVDRRWFGLCPYCFGGVGGTTFLITKY